MLLRPAPTNDDTVGETYIETGAHSRPAGAEPEDLSATTVVSAEPPAGESESASGASSKEQIAPPTTAPPPAAPSPPPPPPVVHRVADASQWYAAVAAVKPGETIQLVATINQNLRYRGSRAPSGKQDGPDGTAERPITITAAPDVWINPGTMTNRLPALDIIDTSHVHVVGVNVTNSQFGIRIQDSNGTPEAPLLVASNQVVDVGHAGIHIVGDLNSHDPSRHIRVEGNTVTRTGRTAAQFGEGIYLGYGSKEWVDGSSNLTVVNNHISFTTAEGIDIKPGTKNVLVEGNDIHDLSPLAGGAISAHYVGNNPNPDPATPANVTIRNNRIWNVNLDGRAGSNDWAIWVGHGGITIEGNAIWGLRNDPGRTRAIRIRALQDFGPHPIRIVDNIFWTSTGWLAEGSPSGAGVVKASGNQGPAGANGIEVALKPNAAVPPLGTGGTADNGAGPGSALGHRR